MQHSCQHIPESAPYSRPISPAEWWLACYPEELVSMIQLVVEGHGSIDPQQLVNAVEIASAACPGARLIRDNLSWQDSGKTPEVHVVNGPGLDGDDVIQLAELKAVLGGEGVTTCEVVLVRGPLTTVAFRACHAVMDAKGIMLWAADVFRALRGEPVLGAPDPMSEADILAGLSVPPAATSLGIDLTKFALPSVLGRSGAPRQTSTVVRRRSLQGHHPGLTAKLATAMTEAVGLETGIFYIPVDLRRYRPEVRSTGNMVGTIMLKVQAGEGWEQAHERLLRALADGEDVRRSFSRELLAVPAARLSAAVSGLNQQVGDKDMYPWHAAVSHAGRIDLSEFRVQDFTPRSAYQLSHPSPLGAPELAVLEVEGRTELTLSWWDGPGVADRIDALLDRIERAVAPAADRPRDSTELTVASGETVVGLFARQAISTPDAIATSGPEGELTYADLEHRSAVVAAELHALGVGRETVVGVLADRSASAIVAIWGVLRAGGAYLPLDAQHPDARLADLLADADAPVCLVQRPYDERESTPPGCERVVIESLDYSADPPPLDVTVQPHDLAYVIYTSGSTGRPKGVEITHHSLMNYVSWATREFGIDSTTRLPLIVSLSFDVAGNTIFLPLVAGGTVVLMSGEVNHATLRDLLTSSGANTLSLTPSHLDLISRLNLEPAGIRAVVVIGEQLRRSVAQRAQLMFGQECRIINSYGPTEATIAVTAYLFDNAKDTAPAVPIGGPIGDNKMFLLDPCGRYVTPGEPGELYLAGTQLARGYRGRPDLNHERFVCLADGTRTYRTGDIVRALPTGELEFTGRMDDQVKVLGHRIEPSEIAQVLETHPAVGHAVVVPHARPGQPHSKILCAYVVTIADVTVGELNEYVAQQLPRYMVPSVTLFLDAIPQTVNGKVDVRGLPEPFVRTGDAVDVTGRDELGTAVARIWTSILALPTDQIAPDADFQQLGGDSVQLLSMLAAVSAEVLSGDGEAKFLAELGTIIREPTLERVTELARSASPVLPAMRPPGR